MRRHERHSGSHRHRGSALVVGLLLLALVSLLALAAAAAAHVELQLARNDWFRENASSAASAGIESAILRIVTSSDPVNTVELRGDLPGTHGTFVARIRDLGRDAAIPQEPGAGLAAALYEIVATGEAPRGAYDRQRAIVMRVERDMATPPTEVAGTDCEPIAAGVRCVREGDWRRLSWQRVARE